MNAILSVHDVSKKIKVFDSPAHRVIEQLFRTRRHREKWVLRDIGFEISAGESVGLVGLNGSGKSTLLSIVTGSRPPTTGRVTRAGTTSALLELGMGFHPEFTGRENAVMGLQLQGCSGDRLQSLLPWIEQFSELREYFHMPLRTYSSGMQVRLAFSVATAVRPDLLVIDEALSVGDRYFQHRSTSRIREMKAQGTSLLFVSHDPSAVKSLCDRTMLLDKGSIILEGKPDTVMDYYNAMIAEKEQATGISQWTNGQTRSGSKLVTIEAVNLVDMDGEPRDAFRVGDPVRIRCSLRTDCDMDFPTVGISVRDRIGNEVFGTNTWHMESFRSERIRPGQTIVEFNTHLNLGPGSYSITAAAHTGMAHLENNYDWWDRAHIFDVLPGAGYRFQGTSFLQVSAAIVPNPKSAIQAGEVSHA